MAITKTQLPNLQYYYDEDLSVLESMLETMEEKKQNIPQAILEVLEERKNWEEMGMCDKCGSHLKSENNGYDEGEGPTMWELYCPQGH